MDVRIPLYSGCLTDSSIESYTACWQQPLKHPMSGYVLQGLNCNSSRSLWNSGSMDCCVYVSESWHAGDMLHLLSSLKFTQAKQECMSPSKVNQNMYNKYISLVQVNHSHVSAIIHDSYSFHKYSKTQSNTKTRSSILLMLYPLKKHFSVLHTPNFSTI